MTPYTVFLAARFDEEDLYPDLNCIASIFSPVLDLVTVGLIFLHLAN